MAEALLDFLYLDIPRLESFASQLLVGVPEAATSDAGREFEVGAEVEGGLPFLLKGTGNTKAVFSANSTVTSRVHHALVHKVIEELERRELLIDDPDTAADGSFVMVDGPLQIVDAVGLAQTLRIMPTMLKTASLLQTGGSQPHSLTGQAARAARQQRSQEQSDFLAQEKQLKAFADVIDVFGKETVRIRVLEDGGSSRASAVVERDKFVEPLERLVLRHGYRTGGAWKILGQVNVSGEAEFFQPDGETLLDIVEKTGVSVLQMVATLAAGSDASWTITPLAIYRETQQAT
jgi:hypothetical protein